MKGTTNKKLVIGAAGQIGVELVAGMIHKYRKDNVIATDIKPSKALDHCIHLDVLCKQHLIEAIETFQVDDIYLLAAMLSASGEKAPQKAWDLNMKSLLNVLDAAVECKVSKVFFPSSIAVYGPQLGKPKTVYGISKYTGELWCQWYFDSHGLDVRSIRYPGLISHTAQPGGGTTDYAVEIFHEAIRVNEYECYLAEDTQLPMMYMDDAVRATLELMEAPAANLSTRMGYDIAAFSVTPAELSESISRYLKSFAMHYKVDQTRQEIASNWPGMVTDSLARKDWGWKPAFDLDATTQKMIGSISMHQSLEEKVFS